MNSIEQEVWDYRERLAIDRISGTLTLIKTVGELCVAKNTYYAPDGIAGLRNGVDTSVFSVTEDNPDDVYVDSVRSRSY